MSFLRFVTAISSLILMTGALTWGSRRVRARWLPELSGAVALLCDLVLCWTALLGISQLLGAVGLFKPAPLVAGCVLAGAVAGFFARRQTTVTGPPPSASVERTRLELVIAAVAVAFAVATWIAATSRAFPSGINAFDSIWYHLTRAARFAQDGSLLTVHQTGPEYPDAFHVANAEVVHAIGMLLFGQDLLSPVLNMAWLACLLVAGWCLGAPKGREPATLAMTALLASMPGFVVDQAGTASNDVATVFFVLACAAFVLRSPVRPAGVVVAALAAGLAMGTKLTALAAVGALTIGVFVVWRRSHGRRLIWTWIVPLVGAGGFWYGRNLIATGTPFPGLRLSVAGLSLPYGGFALVDVLGYRLTHYAFDIDVWRRWFFPALARWFGPLWPLVFVIAGCGIVLSLVVGKTAVIRMLGFVALAALAGYTLIPSTALGPPGQPLLFAGAFVYAVPGLLLALTLVPLAMPSHVTWRAAPTLALSIVVVLAQVTDRTMWHSGTVLTAAVSGAAVLALAMWMLLRPSRSFVRFVMASVAVGVIVAGWFGAGWYADRRYADDPLAQWAASVRPARIAEAGVPDEYRLHDLHLSNRVEFIGDRGPHGAIHPARSCAQWRDALRRGRFDHVVLRTGDYSTNSPSDSVEAKLGLSSVGERELQWTRYDPAASESLRVGRIIIYDFDPRVPDPGC